MYVHRSALLATLAKHGVEKVDYPTMPWEGQGTADMGVNTVTLGYVYDAWDKWVHGLPEELRELRQGPRGYRYYPRWIKEVFDCDNHDQDFRAHCVRDHAVTAQRNGWKRRGGTGVLGINIDMKGSFGYYGAHRTQQLVVSTSSTTFRLVPFEPAIGIEINLSVEEWASIYKVYQS